MFLSINKSFFRIICGAILIIITPSFSIARDILITGTITNRAGNPVPNAKISFTVNSVIFGSVSATDGSYSVKITGSNNQEKGSIKLGNPFPNPFVNYVNVPFIIDKSGEVIFSVYDFYGRKLSENIFPSVDQGGYIIKWNGCDQNGTPVKPGFYIFTIKSGSITRAGRLLRVAGAKYYTSQTWIMPYQFPGETTSTDTTSKRISLITEITHSDYYPVRLTDISVTKDTVIDFLLSGKQAIPFKTSGNFLAMYTDNTGSYRPINMKGINLGSSPPGYWPGEIAYAITDDMYKTWIEKIAESGFNCIRVYTLHPPVFYEKLAEYNQRHPDKPLLLFQGIWLDEMESFSSAKDYDLLLKEDLFKENIEEVINCIHGNDDIAFRAGRAYGSYKTDISQWTAGYIIGREIAPQEVDSTNKLHPALKDYSGYQFSISDASASNVFVTRMLDKVVSYESSNYKSFRPVSISSWPTLDPLTHSTEIYTDEDKASIDVALINGAHENAGMFISYHAYPYYPNFISQEPGYRTFSDSYGPDSYLGYLTALKNHYKDIPLVIGEFGVPSSWGSAHQSFSDMNHGGYSEKQQGEKDARLITNVFSAGCAGGFIFSWMDEWFKPTWIVQYLEAKNTYSGSTPIPTRQLWHNLLSAEQNFGLISFEQNEILPFESFDLDKKEGAVASLKATNSNEYFFLELTTNDQMATGDTVSIAFDTYDRNKGESVLPNGKSINNRSEFVLNVIAGKDSAYFYVTQAYDMYGLTPRFDLADHSVQKFKTVASDGAPWHLMRWLNDQYTLSTFDTGIMPVENAEDFTPGERTAVAWNQNKMTLRIPWTMLYYYDPTQMKVIDGAVSNDGGRSYEVTSSTSDGIAVSISIKGSVINTTNRYIWTPWLVVPATTYHEKESLKIVGNELQSIPYFVL